MGSILALAQEVNLEHGLQFVTCVRPLVDHPSRHGALPRPHGPPRQVLLLSRQPRLQQPAEHLGRRQRWRRQARHRLDGPPLEGCRPDGLGHVPAVEFVLQGLGEQGTAQNVLSAPLIARSLAIN